MARRHVLTFLPLLAVGVVLLVGQRDNVEAFFHQFPRLDASTPDTQDRLKMLGFQKLVNGSVRMLVRAPQIPNLSSEEWNRTYSPEDAFAVKAHASTGESWEIGWEIHTAGTNFLDPAGGGFHGEKLLFISLPTAYPPHFKWVDLEVKDKWHRRAVWRLTKLPRARELLTETTKGQDTYDQGGVFAHAEAVWEYSKKRPSREHQANVIVGVEASPSPHRRWEYEFLGVQQQWIGLGEHVFGERDTSQWTNPVFENPGTKAATRLKNGTWQGSIGQNLTTHYPAENTHALLALRLKEFSTTGDENEGGELISSRVIYLTPRIQEKGPVEVRFGKKQSRL